MRALLSLLILTFLLAACGYRTPLVLPKPQGKPPATANVPAPVPEPMPAQSDTP